uniref:XPG N-terminal domain-containing protein n=1 Tax=Paramormyrops kingsleyae TaxID=1676925 RepID=A0A3B3SVL8_9TELE
MGVRGLYSYVMGKKDFFQEVKVQDTKLIIDGSNILYYLAFWPTLDLLRVPSSVPSSYLCPSHPPYRGPKINGLSFSFCIQPSVIRMSFSASQSETNTVY